MLSFQEKLRSDYYSANQYNYITAAAARMDPAKARQRELYQADKSRRHEEFKADALEEVGLTGHPKADVVFAKAEEHGHSEGYYSIYQWLEDLAELVL